MTIRWEMRKRRDTEEIEDKELDELELIRLRKMRDLMNGVNSSENVTNLPTVVTDATFDDFSRKNSLAVVDCWADWCGPCRMIGPVIEQLAKDFAGKVAFGKLNVDQNPTTATRFRIMSIPTLLIMRNGVVIDTIVGSVPKDYIASKLQPLL
jgi:thioredoxin 1